MSKRSVTDITPSATSAAQPDNTNQTTHITQLEVNDLVLADGFKAVQGSFVGNLVLPGMKYMPMEWAPGIAYKIDASIPSEKFTPDMMIAKYDPKKVRVPESSTVITAFDDIAQLRPEHEKFGAVKMFLKVNNNVSDFPTSIQPQLKEQYEVQSAKVLQMEQKCKSLIVEEILKNPKCLKQFESKWSKDFKKSYASLKIPPTEKLEDLVKRPECREYLEKTIGNLPFNTILGSYVTKDGREVETIKFKITFLNSTKKFAGVVKLTDGSEQSLIEYFKTPRRTKVKPFTNGFSLWVTDTTITLSTGFKNADVAEMKSAGGSTAQPSAQSLNIFDAETDVVPEVVKKPKVLSIEQTIVEYFKANKGAGVTLAELAEALGMESAKLMDPIGVLVDSATLYEEGEKLMMA